MERGQPGDIGEAPFEVDGKPFGSIYSSDDEVWMGMSKRYVRMDYSVEFYGFADDALNHEKVFRVLAGEKPATTLSRAKQYARDFVEEHADAIPR